MKVKGVDECIRIMMLGEAGLMLLKRSDYDLREEYIRRQMSSNTLNRIERQSQPRQ